jgi:hypothetical protein
MNFIHLLQKPGTLCTTLMCFLTVLIPHAAADSAICLVTGSPFFGDASLASAPGIPACGNAAGLLNQLSTGGTVSTLPNVLPSPISQLTTGTLLYSDTGGGNGKAFASLDSGTLGDLSVSGPSDGTVAITSVLIDGVHFNITDGASSVPVAVDVHLGGTLGGGGFYSNTFALTFGGFLSYTMSAGVFVPNVGGWVGTPSLTNESVTGFDFSGTLDVTNGESLPLLMSLQLGCNLGESCDFSHTAALSFVLPQDVTFTSDSGVLLTQTGGSPVPEPGSAVVLSICCLVLLGANKLRRVVRASDH